MIRRASRASRWLPPYQVVLALFGILVGLLPGLPRPALPPELILGVFVPALVMEAALNLDLEALRSVARPVALLATAGVALAILLFGFLAHYALRLDWPGAFLLGAILSPTDPIAVVAVIRRSAAPKRLAALLEGESLFNDGIGVAAFAAVLAAISSGHVSPASVTLSFFLLTLGGAAVGMTIGLAGAFLVRLTTRAPLEVGITLLVAYGSYAAATLLGVTGVMAVVTAGVAMARIATWGPHTERWWARIAIVLNSGLFVLIGLGLPAGLVIASGATVLAGFAVLFGARLLPVYALGFGIPHRWRQLMWWGGVRGALSVALALAAAGVSGVDRRIPVIAYGIVVVSLLVQGTAVRPAIRVLGIGREGAEGGAGT